MLNWLALSEQRRREIINSISFKTGLAVAAIEKDWYVTLALYAVFQTQWASEIVFKGGTSLSKAWRLISRFSEDVDLAITPTALGKDPQSIRNSSQVRNLRKASGKFMEGPFLTEFTKVIRDMDITEEMLGIKIRTAKYSDEDPRIIELEFPSLFPNNGEYLKKKVELEIGARSLREPFLQRPIQSILDETLPQLATGIPAFNAPSVTPDRTFLEKMFLLHEEFTKAADKVRHHRMSRHLYDLYYIADNEFGKTALTNLELFETIRSHRSLYNEHYHIDYSAIEISHMIIIPPEAMLQDWEADYKQMRESMMAKDPPAFQEIIQRLSGLASLFKKKTTTNDMQKTIIVMSGTANVGKSMTLSSLGRQLHSAGGDTTTDITAREYHAVFSYLNRVVGVQTFGDNFTVVSEGLEDFRQKKCDVIAIATKSSGATVVHLNEFAAANGYRVIFIAPYEVQDGSISTDVIKNYGARHLLFMVNDIIAGSI